jgi:hypothetical protein
MVKGYEPAAVSAAVVSVSVEEVPETGAGLKPAETPAGSALVARAMLPENPPVRGRLTEYVVPLPAATLWLVGETPIEKSDAAGDWTTSLAEVLCVIEPLVPVTVSA